MDSQLKAQELASLLLSSSPSQIPTCCSAIEAFFHKHSTDQTRSFFSITFPTLIYKLFGFEDPTLKSPSSTGWIDQIESSSDYDRVFKLLSPSGHIFSSIHAVDRHFPVKYAFPIERLPEWTRFMLQSDHGCRILSDFCPLFKDRVKGDSNQSSFQVQLNVFEYYMFWFSFYPVCKGKRDDSDLKQVRKDRRFGLRKWTSLPGLQSSNRGSALKTKGNLYNRLLYAYLRAFVPNYGLNTYQPYRSSLLHYSSKEDDSIALQSEFLVHTLIHFWLVDNDFSPLPVNISRSFDVSVPFRAILDQCPPSAGLGEVAKIFVLFLNSGLFSQNESSRGSVSNSVDVVKYRTIPSLFHGNSVDSLNVLVQRPLYRFILRTFLFCPIGASMKNVSQVFQLWISYLEPWKISLEDFSEFNVQGDQLRVPEVEKDSPNDAGKEKGQSNYLYTASWLGYVLSNYLFYSSLLMHFLGFAHKFLHANADVIIQMTLKVLNILTSKELMDLLKNVDNAYHSKPSGSSPMFDRSYKFVPSIREQLLDWEDGLSSFERDADGLHSREISSDLKLFSAREDGGHQLLQLLILRAEPEIQALSRDKLAQNLQTLDSLRAKMKCLFGPTGLPRLVIPEPESTHVHSRDEVFTPKHPNAGTKYKGDWMKRPITDGEVAWLTRLLVRLSDWLNESLGLAPPQEADHCMSRSHGHAGTAWSYVSVPGDEVVVPVRFEWWVFQGILRFLRQHELRINLRLLASKVVVMFFLACVIFGLLRMAFRFVFLSFANSAAYTT